MSPLSPKTGDCKFSSSNYGKTVAKTVGLMGNHGWLFKLRNVLPPNVSPKILSREHTWRVLCILGLNTFLGIFDLRPSICGLVYCIIFVYALVIKMAFRFSLQTITTALIIASCACSYCEITTVSCGHMLLQKRRSTNSGLARH